MIIKRLNFSLPFPQNTIFHFRSSSSTTNNNARGTRDANIVRDPDDADDADDADNADDADADAAIIG